MALVTHPSTMVFDANGCTRHYTLINTGHTNLVYKIKWNNFKRYQFKPVEGFIAAGETQEIEITRTVCWNKSPSLSRKRKKKRDFSGGHQKKISSFYIMQLRLKIRRTLRKYAHT
ncbi:hypothetical protein Y032_0506g2685 [Ancylostoma ceylanicum]|uniref:MSP domain-containing protein n=1 Tax=Ancylostoma ceylanicum TaxID=53326 RepID=A0A016WUY8_9BILA|nr:hypothetical protein Y032_0506g2685 [Ancylostoma ceylanicum]